MRKTISLVASALLVGLAATSTAIAAAVRTADGKSIMTPFCKPPVYPTPPLEEPNPRAHPNCAACPKNCTASPCFLGNGTYAFDEVDLVVPTPGLPIVAARGYLSSRAYFSELGNGWRPGFTSYLVYSLADVNPDRYWVNVTLPGTGMESLQFRQNTDGTFQRPPGRFETLVRNGNGTWTLTQPFTRLRWEFTAAGQISQIVDPFGNTLNYTYDAQGRYQRITDGSGSGRYIEITYTPNGFFHLIRDHTGRTVDYRITNGFLFDVEDAAGRETHYTYEAGRWDFLLDEVKDHWGRTTHRITYDTADRVKTYLEAGETYTIQYDYQGPNRRAKIDSLGNRWVYTLLPSGAVERIDAPDGTFVLKTYDSAGLVQEVRDEVGVRTFFTYDSLGRLVTETHDYSGPEAIRFETTYDPMFTDRIASVTARNVSTGNVDRDWQSWRYDYHPTGSPAPGALHHVYRVRNDGTEETVGTNLYNSKGQLTRFTNARGQSTDYGYDSSGNLTTITGPANNDAGTRPVTTHLPDALGRTLSVTDPLNHTASFTYDALGRVLTLTQPKPSVGSPLTFVTTSRYDRSPVGDTLETHIVDRNSRTTRLGHDQFGRLAYSIDPLGNETRYSYRAGLLDTISDANGNATRYSYNATRRVAETQFPDGAIESYQYHPDGSLRERTDRRNQTIRYTFDRHKRIDSEQLPIGTIDYTYDGEKLVQVFDTSIAPAETHSFTYDKSYRLESTTQGPRGTVSYTYFPDDSVAGYAIAGGASTSYSYYPDGSVSEIAWSLIAGSFKYRYDLTGRYQSVTFPNNQTRSFTFDDQGRLTQIANVHPNAGNLATYSYTYDRDHTTGTDNMLGERTGMIASVPAQGLALASTKYHYDGVYRLARVDYPSAAPFNGEIDTWTYDGIGNRLTSTVNGVTHTYDYQSVGGQPHPWQRLLSDGDRSYTYDSNGNNDKRTGSVGQINLGYDSKNRLISLSGSSTASYSYDFRNRRIAKSLPGATHNYLYDGDHLVRESGTTTMDFLFGPGIDEPLAGFSGGASVFFNVDGLGSVTAMNAASGPITATAVFDVWGQARSLVGTSPSSFGFTARETSESGLVFFRARYYDPSIGRFSQEDPLRFISGTNFFGYVGARPASSRDPSGMLEWADTPDWAVSLLEWGANLSAGFADTITIGGTKSLRRVLEIDNFSNYCSGSYKTGRALGWLHQGLQAGSGLFYGGARSVFYSGRHSDIFATAFKGEGRLITETIGGRALAFVESIAGRGTIDPAWRVASRFYAANATGYAPAFLTGALRTGSTFQSVELPTINFFKNVTLLYRFPS